MLTSPHPQSLVSDAYNFNIVRNVSFMALHAGLADTQQTFPLYETSGTADGPAGSYYLARVNGALSWVRRAVQWGELVGDRHWQLVGKAPADAVGERVGYVHAVTMMGEYLRLRAPDKMFHDAGIATLRYMQAVVADGESTIFKAYIHARRELRPTGTSLHIAIRALAIEYGVEPSVTGERFIALMKALRERDEPVGEFTRLRSVLIGNAIERAYESREDGRRFR